MARRKNSGNSGLMPVMPSPKEEFEWSMRSAVEKAVLAHPQTQKLRKEIEREMTRAAKTPMKKGK